MPCVVRGEEHIPIARYGASNVAKMKEAYRRGLSLRYGSFMQTIAGIHFNFSLPDAFWGDFLDTDDDGRNHRAKIRLLLRAHPKFPTLFRWLPCYLFGASPAVCKSFLQGRSHQLDEFDAHSFYTQHATSLRLSGLGYDSSAQAGIAVCYNSLDEFAKSLRRAIQTPHAAYQKFGVKVNGEYAQLNANLLQIENEFYSVIRPKRVAASGESPVRALRQRGVQYVEVRSVDLDPFVPVGINAECVHFFDLLLLYCLFAPSPKITGDEWACATQNRQRVVMNGRQPGLKLRGCSDTPERDFKDYARELLTQMTPLAELLDEANPGENYRATLQAQLEKIDDPELTPSAKNNPQNARTKIKFLRIRNGHVRTTRSVIQANKNER